LLTKIVNSRRGRPGQAQAIGGRLDAGNRIDAVIDDCSNLGTEAAETAA